MELNEVEKINKLAKSLKAYNLAANINEAIEMATNIIRRDKKGRLQEQARKTVDEDVFIGRPVALEESRKVENAEAADEPGQQAVEAKNLFDEAAEPSAGEGPEEEKRIDLEEDAEEILGVEEVKARAELTAEEPKEMAAASEDYDITLEDKTIAELLGETEAGEQPHAEENSEEIKHEIEEEIAEVRAQESAEEQPAEDTKEEPAKVIDEHVIEEIREELAAPEGAAEVPAGQEPKPEQEKKEEKSKVEDDSKEDSEGWVDWTDYKDNK